jgi:hypothetical protein
MDARAWRRRRRKKEQEEDRMITVSDDVVNYLQSGT